MAKRGAALVFALMVMMTLSAVLGIAYLRSISHAQIAGRYVDSMKAFWLAETGIARVMGSAGLSGSSGSLGGSGNTFTSTVTSIGGNYDNVTSMGSVTLPDGKQINRTLMATVKTGAVDPTKFKYGIETTTDLVIKGSVDIFPVNSYKEYSTLDFNDLFTISKAEMETFATHTYTAATFAAPVDGITWVNVPGGSSLSIAGNLVGSGILVIKGDCHISGTVDFTGIVYVIGELTITGTVNTYGSVLAESSTTVDTELKGNVEINYDPAAIAAALAHVSYINKQDVSWIEVY
jgi:hypothetical protein